MVAAVHWDPSEFSDPAIRAVSITPHDTNELATATRAIYVGVAGDVTATLARDSASVLFKAMPVGVHPISVKLVKSTGTTATNIVGLY